MKIYTNRLQYLADCTDVQRRKDGSIASHIPPTPKTWRWQCCDCKGIFDWDVGHAVFDLDMMSCYSCSGKRTHRSFLSADRDFYCYLSGDGQSLTTWTGHKLASTTDLKRVYRRGRQSDVLSFRAADEAGRQWYGRGIPGMLVTARHAKQPLKGRLWPGPAQSEASA